VAPFETKIGSIADYEWLLRLTAHAGSCIARKLAMWRYHGNQLSSIEMIRAWFHEVMASAPAGSLRAPAAPVTRNDCEALLTLQNSKAVRDCRVYHWLKPPLDSCDGLTGCRHLAGLRRAKFRFGTRRYSLLPMILQV